MVPFRLCRPNTSIVRISHDCVTKLFFYSLSIPESLRTTPSKMDHLRPPGDAMPFPAPRRHSTVPMPFQPTPARTTPESVANGSLETLYNHPSVKIVAFTTAKSGSDRLGPAVEDKPGTLPSSSQLERTIAVGMWSLAPAVIEELSLTSDVQVLFRYTGPPDPLPFCAVAQPSNLSFRRASVGA